VRVYPDTSPTRFDLFEDDGETTGYLKGKLRTTTLTQEKNATETTIVVEAAKSTGNYRLQDQRNNILEVVLETGPVKSVSLDGKDLSALADKKAWAAADRGWFYDGGTRLLIKSGSIAVDQRKEFKITQ
jgi:hypothetical protein